MLLSTTYLGPVLYYKSLLTADSVLLEACESWQKPSYRNRCYIDGPNGKLMLSIPVQASSTGIIRDVKVSYKDNWHQKHWHALKTTYNTSPFFEILAPDLHSVYLEKPQFLWDLNLKLMTTVMDWLQYKFKWEETKEWMESAGNDYREAFHPKREEMISLPSYPQVFDHKNNFIPNLSIVDLMFNEGPAAAGYLNSL